MHRPARFLLILLAVAGPIAAEHARNVILFLGDGTGPSTLGAASIYAHGKPHALYIQNMPNLALAETSSADSWVADSAAGMTAIVTGQKNDNDALSVVPKSGGAEAGKPLKTILEYAEEHGLSTAVVSNSPMYDATPAACYAHSASRKAYGEIFAQILTPRFGDGVDLVIGPGWKVALEETAKLGIDLPAELAKKGYRFLDNLDGFLRLGPESKRVVAVWDGDDFDLGAAVAQTIRILSRNPKGYFLMVESDNHFSNAEKCLSRTARMDEIVHQTTQQVKSDTLVLVTADHSWDLRLVTDSKSTAIGRDRNILSSIRIGGAHSGEDVLVAADGPGSEAVHGIFSSTRLFHIMMAAYGWE
jgi:alkaline phosphatase